MLHEVSDSANHRKFKCVPSQGNESGKGQQLKHTRFFPTMWHSLQMLPEKFNTFGLWNRKSLKRVSLEFTCPLPKYTPYQVNIKWFFSSTKPHFKFYFQYSFGHHLATLEIFWQAQTVDEEPVLARSIKSTSLYSKQLVTTCSIKPMLNGDVNYTRNVTSFPPTHFQRLTLSSLYVLLNHSANHPEKWIFTNCECYFTSKHRNNRLNEWEIVKILTQKYIRRVKSYCTLKCLYFLG